MSYFEIVFRAGYTMWLHRCIYMERCVSSKTGGRKKKYPQSTNHVLKWSLVQGKLWSRVVQKSVWLSIGLRYAPKSHDPP